MSFTYTMQTRPIDQWPGQLTKDRRRSPFRAGYGATMDLLETELRHLGARSPALLMALAPEDIRLDGRPRAGAQPRHPGVILVFEDRRGQSMRFPCDRFTEWADNLRAIALALEALRTVDRYGVTQSGEQYRGWQALPPPNGDHWTATQAWAFIATLLGRDEAAPPASRADTESALRAAELKTHPDRGGAAGEFHKVQQARKLLLPG